MPTSFKGESNAVRAILIEILEHVKLFFSSSKKLVMFLKRP